MHQVILQTLGAIDGREQQVGAKVPTTSVLYLTVIKTTLIYEAGCYGEFVFNLLNLREIKPEIRYNAHGFDPINTHPFRHDHHLLSENDVKGHVTKITYTDKYIDLINRNKWTKVTGGIENFTSQKFPEHINKTLFAIAIGKINLLDSANKFKKILRADTLEIKFESFFFEKSRWITNFANLLEKLGIKVNISYLEECHTIFSKSQEKLIKFNKEDTIFLGNKLGDYYYQKHGTNIDQIHMENMLEQIGGHNEANKEKK